MNCCIPLSRTCNSHQLIKTQHQSHLSRQLHLSLQFLPAAHCWLSCFTLLATVLCLFFLTNLQWFLSLGLSLGIMHIHMSVICVPGSDVSTPGGLIAFLPESLCLRLREQNLCSLYNHLYNNDSISLMIMFPAKLIWSYTQL